MEQTKSTSIKNKSETQIKEQYVYNFFCRKTVPIHKKGADIVFFYYIDCSKEKTIIRKHTIIINTQPCVLINGM